MKDYASMSDFEINKAVALLCQIEGVVINDDDEPVRNIIDDSPGSYSGGDYIEVDFDPCNNQADAWSILLENHIAVVPYRHTLPHAWPTAFGLVSKFTTEDANPLRAGMVTFLKMKESEND